MGPGLIFDNIQANALRGVIGAAHPYKAVLPNRWTRPNLILPQDQPPIFPKPSIGTQPGGGPPSTTAQDLVESPQPLAGQVSGPGDAPAEQFPHIYHFIMDEVQYRDYPGKYTIFGGIEQDIQRAIRIPYLYYRYTPNGTALLVKEHFTVLYEGGAGH